MNTDELKLLKKFHEELKNMPGFGYLTDEPEGSRYIKVSETLAKQWAKEIGDLIENAEDPKYLFSKKIQCLDCGSFNMRFISHDD